LIDTERHKTQAETKSVTFLSRVCVHY